MVFSPDLGGKNGGVLSMRMQVILDSPFARPGSAPMSGAGRKESSGTGLVVQQFQTGATFLKRAFKVELFSCLVQNSI